MAFRRCVFFFLISFTIPLFSFAEYRVFVLKISKKTAAPTPGNSRAPAEASDFRLVESTLDPEQYRYYYPIAADETVTYTATWRCYGRTDNFKPHCPNPKDQIPSTENP
ncbi:MAG: hypothetical protein ACXVCP_03410 [Bdellovibrio sp.]